MRMVKFEGFHPPIYCPRGLNDCQSLNQIISSDQTSFICCGQRAVPEDDDTPQDKYTVCFKNDVCDEIQNYDKRDIIHTAAVLMGAAAIIEEIDSVQYHAGRRKVAVEE